MNYIYNLQSYKLFSIVLLSFDFSLINRWNTYLHVDQPTCKSGKQGHKIQIKMSWTRPTVLGCICFIGT